ncbi:MAG: Asp-tRNA(Asn)/Glu-tRNA(Gln) amidotransferase subunit GatC [Parachlamydiaceae bacterium]|nr:Asp-tRNA(Asn)/Glu-tRNA(Gln) amidotransferase subunit GatC [Parachlamydiaceae bacterium]
MGELDDNTIKHLMMLCRIQCTEEEQVSLLADLRKILEYANLLQEVDTSQVAPCSHVLEDLTAFMRDDIPENVMSRDAFLSNAPEVIGGMVRVPRVLKSN